MVYQGESTRSFPGRDFRSLIIFLAAASFVSSVDMSWRSRCWSGGGLGMLSRKVIRVGIVGNRKIGMPTAEPVEAGAKSDLKFNHIMLLPKSVIALILDAFAYLISLSKGSFRRDSKYASSINSPLFCVLGTISNGNVSG